jgi:hypothetical protein
MRNVHAPQAFEFEIKTPVAGVNYSVVILKQTEDWGLKFYQASLIKNSSEGELLIYSCVFNCIENEKIDLFNPDNKFQIPKSRDLFTCISTYHESEPWSQDALMKSNEMRILSKSAAIASSAMVLKLFRGDNANVTLNLPLLKVALGEQQGSA